MKKNFKPQPLFYPLPVLIIGTYDEKGIPNAMNAAWGGISDMTEVRISLSPHKTTDNLLKTGAFTVAFATLETVVQSDYVGIVSANSEKDKMKKSGLTVVKSANVNAPYFEEYPVTLECKVKSFENEVLIGEIVNILVDEKVIDKEGKVDASKAHFIAYDPSRHYYLELNGEEVGHAFRDGLKLK